jgi:hypothetical protein
MKPLRFHPILFIALGLSGWAFLCFRFGKQPITEGKIIYTQIGYEDSLSKSNVTDTLLPVKFTQYFRGQRFRLEIEFFDGKSEVILGDSVGGQRTWLVETPTNKWAVQRAMKIPPFVWKETKETERFAGYKCRAMITEWSPKMKLLGYQSEEVLSPHWFFSGKKGLLAFELPGTEQKVAYHAKEVQDYRVGETQLRIPPKYEKISEADFYHWLSE